MLKIKNKTIIALIIFISIAFLFQKFNMLNLPNLEDSTAQTGGLYLYDNENEVKSTAYLCSLFDELNNNVNQGKGYSEYLNTDGFPTGALLAWSESYLVQAYANMYRATGDIKYLDKLHDHIESVLSNRDDKIEKKDYKNELVPCWGTDRNTKDRG